MTAQYKDYRGRDIYTAIIHVVDSKVSSSFHVYPDDQMRRPIPAEINADEKGKTT